MPYTIAVVGTGYVGLVSGTCFAESGNQVLCVDIDPKKVEMLEAGGIPIYEPGLDLLLERNIRERRIRFTLDLEASVLKSEIIFLCLPTPPDEDGSADLKYVLQVAHDIGQHKDRQRQEDEVGQAATAPSAEKKKIRWSLQ